MRPRHPDLYGIVDRAMKSSGSDRQLAIKLHDAVRDTIAFGFTPYFDAAGPQKTLALGVGHCNPQARLMVELFRLAGLTARFRPATISDSILRGIVTAVPRLSHVFTEVKMADTWLRLDSYIIDPPLRRAAVAKLRSEKKEIGYGCHVAAEGTWNGTSDCFSQVADPQMILELHDPVDDIEAFFASKAYRHRAGPMSFNLLLAPWRLVAPLAIPVLNARVERLRRKGRHALKADLATNQSKVDRP